MKSSRKAGLALLALTLACSRSAPPFVIPDLEDHLRTMLSLDNRDQDHAISFITEEGVPLIIWIGPDWLGGFDEVYGKDGRSIDRHWPLSDSERKALPSLTRKTDPTRRVVLSKGEYL